MPRAHARVLRISLRCAVLAPASVLSAGLAVTGCGSGGDVTGAGLLDGRDEDEEAQAEGATREGASGKGEETGTAEAEVVVGSAVSCDAKPSAATTGPTTPQALVPASTLVLDVPGMVVENVSFSGGVKIKANGVTLRNFRVDGGTYGIQATFGATGILVEDGEVLNATSAGIYGGGFTARRLNIHDSGGDAIRATGNVVVESSWFHHLGKGDGASASGNHSRSGSHIAFRCNHCDMPDTVAAPYKTEACFMLQTVSGPLTGVVIERNWLNGGNYTVHCPSSAEVRVKNNRFGRDYRQGIRTGSCATWTGNTWEDSGAPAP